jgi:hypothetical protein
MSFNAHDYLPNPENVTPHVASLGAIALTVGGWVPWIVALIPAIYYLILIYESATVQGWIRCRRLKVHHKNRKRLRSKPH